MKLLSLDRTISPYIAVLIIVIFSSVMTLVVNNTAHALIAFETEQEILEAALR
jgi:di/tricarboxylate transporter